MFLSSEIVKWRVSDCTVLDRIPTYYSLGHLMIPGGDSRKPWGKYLLAMNKITKDRYLPTGPELNQAAQLIDISGDKMKLLLDFPTVGEPHYAQAHPGQPDQGQPGADLRHRGQPRPVRQQEREGRQGHPEGQPGRHLDDGHPQPLRARQHRGYPGGRLGLLPHHQPRAGLGRAARLRRDRRAQLRAPRHAGPDPHHRLGAGAGRRLPVLLHRLLLGAAPGDAGLHPGVAEGWRTRHRFNAPK